MFARPRSARPTRRPQLGVQALETRDTPTASAIVASFNKSPIPAGDTVWFSSVGKVAGLGAGTTSVHLTGGAISFTAGSTSYAVPVPDATVTFTPLATRATTTYSASGGWLVTAPLHFNGNVFLGGAALAVPGGLPGGIKNVTWSTNVTADAPKVSVSWKWAAAAYSSFGLGGGFKAVDDKVVDAYANSDHAGTPEGYKPFVVAGALGTGGTNYTGNYSGAKTVAAGPAAPPPSGPASLSGTVFQDSNGDRLIGAGDLGLGGIEMDLYDAGGALVASTTTADDGTYSFAGLAAGTYSVQLVPPDDTYNVLMPQVGSSGGTVDPSWAAVDAIQLGAGVSATGYNLGVWQQAF